MELKINNQKENHQAPRKLSMDQCVDTMSDCKTEKWQMGGDGKATVPDSWPRNIWLSPKMIKEGSEMRYIVFISSILLAICLK